MARFDSSRSLRWLWIASSVLVAPSIAAQQVVRGTVSADSAGRGIVGALVRIGDNPQSVVTTDRAGRYLLQLPPDATALTVRAIGYRPLTVSIARSTVDTLTLDFRLIAEAVRLPDVTTTVDAEPSPSARLMEFERRRQTGFGVFLTRAQIARNETLPMSFLLRALRGVRLLPRPPQCGGGYAVATTRAAGFGKTGQPLHCPINPLYTFPVGCYLAVFLDGHLLWAYTSPDPPDLDAYPLSLMEAIEVYRGAGQIPPEFNTSGAACGAIVMWTRVGG